VTGSTVPGAAVPPLPQPGPLASSSPAPDAGESRRQRDRSLASGVVWTAGAKWAAQVLSWASTLVVARLLTPADYGLIGMATVYLGLVQLVSEFGLGAAIVQKGDLTTSQIARINTLSLMIGVGLFGLSALVAGLLASFFGEPAVKWVVMALATTYVITSLQVVPNGLLARDLRFRRLATIEAADALVVTAVTLALALAGARYWSLVIGSIAGRVAGTVQFLLARRHPMAWPRRLADLKRVLTFGWQVVVSRLSWYAYSNADFLVIGRLLGKVALGAYSFGWNIASIPAEKISAVMGRVTMPVFAQVQNDPAALTRYLVRLSEVLVFVVLPASIGMTLIAPDFVRFVLGEHWVAAIIPLQLLSAHVTVRCVNGLFSQALLAMGDTRRSMQIGLVQVAVMPALFVVGAKLGGAPGVAVAWLIGHPIITFTMLVRYVARRVEMSLRMLADALWPAAACTLVMAAVVTIVRVLLLSGADTGVRLAGGVAAGAATYPLVMLAFFRPRVQRIAGALRQLRR
jgi:PST family polysaccharide transporter